MPKKIFTILVNLFLVITIMLPQAAGATAASSNYKVYSDQVGAIGGLVNSTNYSSEQSNQPIGGQSASANYTVNQGGAFGYPTAQAAAGTPGTAGGGTGLPVSGDKDPPQITDLWIVGITRNQARIIFDTNELSVTSIEFGVQGNYRIKTNSEPSFSYRHGFILENLLPGTTYNFIVNLRGPAYNSGESRAYFFTTLSITEAIPNVSGFRAVARVNKVDLSWGNPVFANFAGVKLVRNTANYPASVSSGELLFSGMSQSYTDVNVRAGQTYYYTIFVYDTFGNLSSGAIASAAIFVPIVPPEGGGGESGVEKPREVPEGVIPAEPSPLPEGLKPSPEKSKINEGMVDLFTFIEQGISKGYQDIVETFKDLSSEIKEYINTKIKKGLIDPYGRLSQNVYETLTAEEKKQVEELINKSLPPVFDEESIAEITPYYLKDKDWQASWHVFNDSETIISIPARLFNKPVELITVTFNTEAYIFDYNAKTDSYEAVIKSPVEKGEYEMIIQIIYSDNTYEELYRVMLVDPYGLVYSQKESPWSGKKDEMIKVPGAKVSLYKMNRTGGWLLWPGNFYNQYNPQTTGGTGLYAFMVPPGSYYLEVEAEGYDKYISGVFKVQDDVINHSVELHKIKSFFLQKLLFLLGILGLIGLFLKNFRRW